MSSTQTLSPGGEPQEGKARFSSPVTGASGSVAHPGTHPIHLPPPPMVAEVTLEGKGYSRGRCPVIRFPWMENCCKLPRFSTHNGNSPDSWLFRRCRWVRLERFPSSDGIGPVRLLLLSCSCVRLDRLPSSDGIGPVRLLLLKNSCARLESCPSSGGISPVRLLLAMPSAKRLDRLLSSGGSVPFSGPPEGALVMKIDWTRCGVPPNPIPSQIGIAVVAFQFMLVVPRRVSFSPQRTLQSAMSPVLV